MADGNDGFLVTTARFNLYESKCSKEQPVKNFRLLFYRRISTPSADVLYNNAV